MEVVEITIMQRRWRRFEALGCMYDDMGIVLRLCEQHMQRNWLIVLGCI
jgi:hypothetical protein